MYDVFLGGTTEKKWRDEFKSTIRSDVSVFDPEDYECDHSDSSVANGIARELYHLEECNTLVFNLLRDDPWTVKAILPIMVMIADSIGRGLQVIVCYDDQNEDLDYLDRYFEYQGVHVVHNLEDLVTSIEETVAQMELCSVDKDLIDV